MHRCFSILAILAYLLFTPAIACAWDKPTHRLICRIAWQTMQPNIQLKAVSLLRAADPDTEIPQLELGSSGSRRNMDFFTAAGEWPDLARNFPPAKRNKYHRAPWHYINIFWTDMPGPAHDLEDWKRGGLLVAKLEEFEAGLRDRRISPSEKGLMLAWLLHQVGDIHQPLHASARVTPATPNGDQGGNLFPLRGKYNNLHAFWDGLVTEKYGYDGDDLLSIDRFALRIMIKHQALSKDLRLGRFMDWAEESHAITKRFVYRTPVRQDPRMPYRGEAQNIAEERVALAGFRLGETLNRALK